MHSLCFLIYQIKLDKNALKDRKIAKMKAAVVMEKSDETVQSITSKENVGNNNNKNNMFSIDLWLLGFYHAQTNEWQQSKYWEELKIWPING